MTGLCHHGHSWELDCPRQSQVQPEHRGECARRSSEKAQQLKVVLPLQRTQAQCPALTLGSSQSH